MVDPNQLEMALLNVAVNARDAMPAGGTLTIRAEEVKDDGERLIRIAMTDTGQGMDATTLSRAADPFFTTKGVGKGTGLGLSMVQGMAAQSGGKFRLESRLGEGTTAIIWLPVAAGSQPEPSRHADLADETTVLRAAEQPLVVLVVDDDPLVLMGTVAMLEDLGHLAIEANTARDALHYLQTGSPVNVLITDYSMPGMNGLELARVARGLRPEISLVLASGYAELNESHELELVRLAKPFLQADIRAAILEAVNGAKGSVV